MRYQLEITKPVIKYLEKLPGDIYLRLKEAILNLEDNPRPHGCEKMSGKNAYRIRVGDYRIIYTIQDKILLVTVIDAGHKREVYRK
ncbi:MAG: plasmid stabilization system [Segetibacter sp.]|nr:plasmid stabilization system [Segetibacter sp.]